MEEENPYAPPVVEPSEALGRQSFSDLDTPTLKKLRNDSHTIRALGAINLFGVLIGLLFVFDPEPQRGVPASVMTAFGVCLTCFFCLATYCSWWRPAWGRILGFISCIMMLISFPIGTVAGIFGMFAYGRGKKLFGPDRYTHKEVDTEWKYRKKNKIS